MIVLRKGTTAIVYFTGTEKVTLTDPQFLFTFTNRETGESVIFDTTNESSTTRYDKVVFTVNDYFESSTTGFYSYSIREFTGNYPISPTYGVVVETGYMYLNPAADFAPTEYADQSNEFKTYNG